MQYDALNRIRTMYYPQDLDSERKQVLPVYNKSGALVSVDIKDNPSATPVNYIQRMAYNAKGQPLLVALGNGVMTRYLYREDNFRLLRMKSEKYSVSSLTYTPSSGTVKQNLSYAYDLSGNIVSISDTTPGCGYGATPDSLTREFSYDALYRLLSASGRETAAYSSVPWQDFYRPENHSLARGYTQTYDYDKLGNIQSLQHVATGGSFTRAFDYVSGKNSLASITIGSNVYNFSHDVNGNITSEGDTARHLQYDFADRLRCFFVQTGTTEPSKYTQYLYDGSGQRVKKITRKQGGGYSSTCYIDGIFEYTKETSAFDAIPNLEIGTWVIGAYSSGGEQNILHIMGGATRRIGDSLVDSTPAIKFALTDQLGSSNLLVDDVGTNVNREEYYPFGETSFGSYAKKRYKFCGKERDEESGLYYYGMRYYSPWTCRFISVDPLAGKYAYQSPYPYASNKPINNIDIDGAETPGQPQSPSGGDVNHPPMNNQNPTNATNANPPAATKSNIDNGVSTRANGSYDKQTGIYSIVDDDTLYSIAKRFNTTPEAIQGLNNLEGTTIYAGKTLKIPNGTTLATSSSPTTNNKPTIPNIGIPNYYLPSSYQNFIQAQNDATQVQKNYIAPGALVVTPGSAFPNILIYSNGEYDGQIEMGRDNRGTGETIVYDLQEINDILNTVGPLQPKDPPRPEFPTNILDLIESMRHPIDTTKHNDTAYNEYEQVKFLNTDEVYYSPFDLNQPYTNVPELGRDVPNQLYIKAWSIDTHGNPKGVIKPISLQDAIKKYGLKK